MEIFSTLTEKKIWNGLLIVYKKIPKDKLNRLDHSTDSISLIKTHSMPILIINPISLSLLEWETDKLLPATQHQLLNL